MKLEVIWKARPTFAARCAGDSVCGSRAALDRLLNPKNESVAPWTTACAGKVLGERPRRSALGLDSVATHVSEKMFSLGGVTAEDERARAATQRRADSRREEPCEVRRRARR